MTVEQMPAASTTTTSQALAAARRERADLHTTIMALEEAIAAPASGRSAEWSTRVHDALIEVSGAFERHIAVVEGPEGLFEEVLEAAPRLAHALDRLHDEHLDVRRCLVDALDAVRLVAGRRGTPADDGREAVLTVLDRLMRHRQHGADVVYDAYSMDIGTGD